MKENIYQTVCPGCNIGCGLYIREDDAANISVDFMKSSPVNSGKLCRFGMQLPSHYSKAASMVEGSEATIEDAVDAAARKLKGTDAAFLSVGATTNEEHLAFTRIAGTLNKVVHTGMGTYTELPSECRPTLGTAIPLEDIETAGRIALFVDPYVQYPLLVRRLLAAKKNGAVIIAVGPRHIRLADETRPISPEAYGSELGLDEGSLIIADVHPHSDPELVKHLLNLALMSGARIMFMKPFVNSTGVHLLSRGTAQQGLKEIMDGINKGSIKTLVTLNSDPLELMPDSIEAARTLQKLDNLIVITSRNGPVNRLANIVIGTEPLYSKAGSFMNVEGQLLNNSGSSTTGIDAMSLLNQKLGGENLDCQTLHTAVLENIVQEHTAPKYRKLECSIMDASLQEKKGNLITVSNPFIWFDQADDNDFVIVNMNTVKRLGLRKNGMMALSSNGCTVKMRFSTGEVQDGMILTYKKLPVATDLITAVAAEGC